MRRVLVLLVLVTAVLTPQASAFGKKPKKAPKMDVELRVAPEPARAGQSATLELRVLPPKGIALNRYPGITFTVDKASKLDFASKEAFVGTKELPEDLTDNAFEKPQPLRFEVTPRASGTRSFEGELSFFYCVKSSGFCAPGKQKVKLQLPVSK